MLGVPKMFEKAQKNLNTQNDKNVQKLQYFTNFWYFRNIGVSLGWEQCMPLQKTS